MLLCMEEGDEDAFMSLVVSGTELALHFFASHTATEGSLGDVVLRDLRPAAHASRYRELLGSRGQGSLIRWRSG